MHRRFGRHHVNAAAATDQMDRITDIRVDVAVDALDPTNRTTDVEALHSSKYGTLEKRRAQFAHGGCDRVHRGGTVPCDVSEYGAVKPARRSPTGCPILAVDHRGPRPKGDTPHNPRELRRPAFMAQSHDISSCKRQSMSYEAAVGRMDDNACSMPVLSSAAIVPVPHTDDDPCRQDRQICPRSPTW